MDCPLQIADLLFIVFCVPFTATDYAFTSSWPFGNLWCKLIQFFIILTAFVSIYTLVLMALDRFLAVVFPVSSKSLRTCRNTQFAIAFSWLISGFFSCPALFLHGLISSPMENSEVEISFHLALMYISTF